jgi:Mg2+ and Co2+ transporter CorA
MKGNLSSSAGLVWTFLSEPAPAELAEFVREADLLPADAEFVVQNHHRPEVAVREGYLIILVHVPTFNKQTRTTRGVPLYFVVREGRLWTIHFEPIVVLEGLWSEFSTDEDKRSEYFSEGSIGLALHIVSELYASAFKKLERLAKHIDIAEDAVFQGNERKMVEEISLLMRDVMDFRKIIRLQTNLFSTIPNHPLLRSPAAPVWSRVHGQTKKLWDILEGLFESTAQLGKTNRDLLQHKENALLRLLTVYSIFSIPALILISPYQRHSPYDSLFDTILYLGIFAAFVVALMLILWRAKRRRIL